jgi:hypothetical protein
MDDACFRHVDIGNGDSEGQSAQLFSGSVPEQRKGEALILDTFALQARFLLRWTVVRGEMKCIDSANPDGHEALLLDAEKYDRFQNSTDEGLPSIHEDVKMSNPASRPNNSRSEL